MKHSISLRRGTSRKPKRFGKGTIIFGVGVLMLSVAIGIGWVVCFVNGANDALAPPNVLPSKMVRGTSHDHIMHQTKTESREIQSQSHGHEMHHLVFSTACSVNQDWQSYLFFFQAMTVNQPGTVTRIVSGCDPEKQETLQATFDEQIKIMSPNFKIHFTPEFGKVPGKDYEVTKYWNKPFGLRHWLENTFGYNSRTTNSTKYDNDIIILIDPDMFLQRPLVNDFSGYPRDVWTEHWHQPPESDHGVPKAQPGHAPRSRVDHGYPIAQLYGFNDGWFHAAGNRNDEVVGKDSPVLSLTSGDASKFYASGPPYILTARDFHRVSVYWCHFLPKLFDIKPDMMNEMCGYSLASAHLKMPNQLARGFMVSNVDIPVDEGWQFLNDVAAEDICNTEKAPLPNVAPVVHFCQRCSMGDHFMSKCKTHANILTCEEPLFKLPPTDAAAQYNYSHFGNGDVECYKPEKRHRHAFMVCSLLPALNAAATFFKKHHCGKTANYEQVWNYFTHWEDQNGAGAKKKGK